jgi:hypothetical protein
LTIAVADCLLTGSSYIDKFHSYIRNAARCRQRTNPNRSSRGTSHVSCGKGTSRRGMERRSAMVRPSTSGDAVACDSALALPVPPEAANRGMQRTALR